jgi:hypothetical protein
MLAATEQATIVVRYFEADAEGRATPQRDLDGAFTAGAFDERCESAGDMAAIAGVRSAAKAWADKERAADAAHARTCAATLRSSTSPA